MNLGQKRKALALTTTSRQKKIVSNIFFIFFQLQRIHGRWLEYFNKLLGFQSQFTCQSIRTITWHLTLAALSIFLFVNDRNTHGHCSSSRMLVYSVVHKTLEITLLLVYLVEQKTNVIPWIKLTTCNDCQFGISYEVAYAVLSYLYLFSFHID